MNTRKIIILCLGFIIGTKSGQAATALPNLVGLRCEFNGAIEFSLKQRKFDIIESFIKQVEKSNPERLYNASNIRDLKIGQFVNGELNYKCRLESNQWTWIMNDTCIRLTLIPYQHIQVYPHRDVYFYNIFNKPLIFKFPRYEYLNVKDFIHIINPGISDVTLEQVASQVISETFYFELQPKQSIKYPIDLKLNLALEAVK